MLIDFAFAALLLFPEQAVVGGERGADDRCKLELSLGTSSAWGRAEMRRAAILAIAARFSVWVASGVRSMGEGDEDLKAVVNKPGSGDLWTGLRAGLS